MCLPVLATRYTIFKISKRPVRIAQASGACGLFALKSQTLSISTAASASPMPATWRRLGHSRSTSAASRIVPAG